MKNHKNTKQNCSRDWVIEVYKDSSNDVETCYNSKKLVMLASKVSSGFFRNKRWRLVLECQCEPKSVKAIYTQKGLISIENAEISNLHLREFYNIEQLFSGWLDNSFSDDRALLKAV